MKINQIQSKSYTIKKNWCGKDFHSQIVSKFQVNDKEIAMLMHKDLNGIVM